MSRTLAARTEYLSDSLPLKIAARAKKMIADGIPVVNLSVGEPDFPTPSAIKQAGVDAIESDFTRYTPAAGIPQLRTAISDFLKSRQNLAYAPEQIVVTVGGKQAIASTLLALIDPGDEVIHPYPCYASYVDLIRLAGGVPVGLKTRQEDGFRILPERLRSLVSARTKAIIINTPNNPTGAAYTPREIEDLGRELADLDLWILSDEVYDMLRYDGNEHLSLAANPGLAGKTALINSVSKYFSMTGWRIGYFAGPAELAAAVAKVQSQVTGCPCSISQKAALEAFENTPPEPGRMVSIFHQRRDLIVKLMREIEGISFHEPEGAFYVFPHVASCFQRRPDIPLVTDSLSLCNYLLDKHHLAIVPGSAFEMDGHVRFSFAASEENIREGVERFKKGLHELSG